MKKLSYIIILLIGTLGVWRCAPENPIEQEQYFKQVYLISTDYRYIPELHYNTTSQETFISVACGGSLAPDQDIEVTLTTDQTVCDTYNQKFFGQGKEDQFYKPLDASLYELPSPIKATIKAGETYARIPVKIKTRDIHCDSIYAIPFRIDTVSCYKINPEVNTLLLAIQLINDYSGSYEMKGTRANVEINKNKNLKACGVDKVRLFFGTTAEDDEKQTGAKCLVLEILADHSVKITPWQDLALTNGSGTYNPQTKTFEIQYDLTEDGNTIHYTETLKKS